MSTKNYTIISLYFSVFLVIGLLTAYFPLWLNQSLKLETQQIGYVLSLSGILKVFFTITITVFIKNGNNLKAYLIGIIVFSMGLFLAIFSLKNILSFNLTFFMVILFLISFSPVLPFIETIYSSLVKEPLKKYGKIRVSGSIAFCLAVFLFGYFISKFSISIFPLILVICLLIIGISILSAPNKIKAQKYNSLKGYKTLFRKKNKSLITFIIACSLLQASHAMYYGYSTIIWESKGLSFFKIGVLWAFAIAAEVILFLKIDKYFKSSLLFKTLLFCACVCFIRWTFTYFFENFFILLIVQTLHGVTFALTHYSMIFLINKNIEATSKLLVQSIYYILNGGIFITIFTVCCGYLISYTQGDEGYLLMSLLAFLSFILLYFKGNNLR